MKMKNPYGYLCRIRIQRALAYNFDVFSTIALQCLIMFASSFFWMALYTKNTLMMGVTREEMFTYTIISSLMSCILNVNVEMRIIQSVQNGSVATDLIKPVNLFGIYLAEDIGSSIMALLQNAIPLILVGCIFIQIPKPASISALILFLISFVLSYAINWTFASIFGMWAFTAISMRPMVEVKKHLIRLLSGSIIPLWFFPDWLRGILNILPFSYIYQMPLSIYIGKLDSSTIAFQFTIQIMWLILLSVIFIQIKKRVLKKVMVQGG